MTTLVTRKSSKGPMALIIGFTALVWVVAGIGVWLLFNGDEAVGLGLLVGAFLADLVVMAAVDVSIRRRKKKLARYDAELLAGAAPRFFAEARVGDMDGTQAEVTYGDGGVLIAFKDEQWRVPWSSVKDAETSDAFTVSFTVDGDKWAHVESNNVDAMENVIARMRAKSVAA